MKLKSILLASATVLMFSEAQAQSFVGTYGKKFTLIEEATGGWCGYCPDGAQILEQKIEPNYSRAIVASWHNGDGLELSGDPFCGGSGYITGFPLGTVNRTAWGSPAKIEQNRGQWEGDVKIDSGTTPKFDVFLKSYYNDTTKTLTVNVTGKALQALTGNWRINAYVLEDSIAATPGGPNEQHSYMYSTSTSWFYNQCFAACPGYPCSSCAVLPSSIYAHMNVVMKVLASGGSIWGDAAFANPAANETKTMTYTYVIPSTSKVSKTKVIGLVQKYGTTTADRAIENAIRARVPQMGGMPTLGVVNATSSNMDNISVYPNPASDFVNVSFGVSNPSETKITITNTIGQVVMEKTYPASGNNFSENISLDNFSNGIYVMTIASNGASTTAKVSVNK